VRLVGLHAMRMDICTVINREFLAQFAGLSVASYICLCSRVVNPWQGSLQKTSPSQLNLIRMLFSTHRFLSECCIQ